MVKTIGVILFVFILTENENENSVKLPALEETTEVGEQESEEEEEEYGDEEEFEEEEEESKVNITQGNTYLFDIIESDITQIWRIQRWFEFILSFLNF